MSRINVTASLLTKLPQIERLILDEFRKKLNLVTLRAALDIQAKLGAAIRAAIIASPEYASIVAGELQAALGIENPIAVMDNVINTIIANMMVTGKPIRVVGNKFSGGLRIEILQADFADVLGVPGTKFTSKNGFNVPWLQWLLFDGDRIVVADYDVVFMATPNSRTGRAHMKPSAKGYRVPPQFSGTVKNNFLTRTLASLVPDIENIVGVAFLSRL